MRRKTVNGKLKRLSERSPLKQKKALPKAGKRSSATADGASAAHARQRAARHCRRHRRQPGRGCGQHFHRAGRATVVQALGAVRFLAAGAGCAAAVRAARGLGGARSGAARRGAHTSLLIRVIGVRVAGLAASVCCRSPAPASSTPRAWRAKRAVPRHSRLCLRARASSAQRASRHAASASRTLTRCLIRV